METKPFFHNNIIFRRGEVLGKEKNQTRRNPQKLGLAVKFRLQIYLH